MLSGKPRPPHMLQLNNQPSVSTVVRSPGLDAGACEVVVTVPTFRRPAQVLETLASLQRQQTRAALCRHPHRERSRETRGCDRRHAAVRERRDRRHDHRRPRARQLLRLQCGLGDGACEFPGISWLAVIDDDEIADPAVARADVRGKRALRSRHRRRAADADLSRQQRQALHQPIRCSCRTTGTAGRSMRSIRPAIC